MTAINEELILRIYDTTLDPVLWSEVLEEVCAHCNAMGGFLFDIVSDPAGGGRMLRAMQTSVSMKAANVEAYLAAHHDDEMLDQTGFADRSQKEDAINVVSDCDIADKLRDRVTGADVFTRPHMGAQMEFGIKHRAGALLNKDDWFRDRLAMQYHADHGPVTDLDRARARQVMPHLAKAISVSRPNREAAAQFGSIVGAVENLMIGVAILDASGRVVFRNREFDRQVDVHRAFKIGGDGKLAFDPDRFDRSIKQLLGGVDNHGKFGARPRKEAVASAIGEDDTFALCVEIAPLRRAEEFGEANLGGHIVYSLDTSQPFKLRSGVLEDLFELTTSEAGIVSLMAEGLTNTQISEVRNRSIHTVNSQVKSVLAKARTANRTQLIRLVTNLNFTLGEVA